VPEAQQQAWPVDISTSGGGTGATVVWRWQGRLYLTAVVKATFALAAGGAMTPRAPEPIAVDEQEDASGLRNAGDLVPLRRRVDVVVTGHALAIRGAGEALVPGRFSVVRDGAEVLAASIHVSPEAPPGTVRYTGVGPLSRRWPTRSRLLGEHDLRRFEGATIDLPPVFDDAYFQAAPPGQRLDALRGDEQIVFEGPGGRRFEARLPGVGAAATLHGPTVHAEGEPLPLAIDTLHVDLDQAVCNVTWRGATTVERRDALVAMQVVATLVPPAAPAMPASDRHPFESAMRGQASLAPDDRDSLERRIFPGSIAPPSQPPAGLAPVPLDATMMLPPELDPASARSQIKPPSERVPLPWVEATEPDRTLTLEQRDALLASGAGALPFTMGEPPKPPPQAFRAPPPSSRRRTDEAPEVTAVTATVVLADALLATEGLPPPAPPASARVGQPPLPPPRLPPKPPAHAGGPPLTIPFAEGVEEIDPDAVVLDTTMAVSHPEAPAAPATPFARAPHAPSPPSAPPPAIASPPVIAPPPMLAPLPVVAAPQSAPPPATPAPGSAERAPITQRTPAQAAPAAPPPAVPNAAAPKAAGAMTFGAHFLAAMEAFESAG
jgi:hypothetical protein